MGSGAENERTTRAQYSLGRKAACLTADKPCGLMAHKFATPDLEDELSTARTARARKLKIRKTHVAHERCFSKEEQNDRKTFREGWGRDIERYARFIPWTPKTRAGGPYDGF